MDRELQDSQLYVKGYLFFRGVIDKEKEKREGRGLYTTNKNKL